MRMIFFDRIAIISLHLVIQYAKLVSECIHSEIANRTEGESKKERIFQRKTLNSYNFISVEIVIAFADASYSLQPQKPRCQVYSLRYHH